jgi:hypothetical protein
MILSKTTFSIMTLSFECQNAECRDYLNIMLSVVMLSVVMLSVVALFLFTCSVPALSPSPIVNFSKLFFFVTNRVTNSYFA